jgi:hypothetical protein
MGNGIISFTSKKIKISTQLLYKSNLPTSADNLEEHILGTYKLYVKYQLEPCYRNVAGIPNPIQLATGSRLRHKRRTRDRNIKGVATALEFSIKSLLSLDM